MTSAWRRSARAAVENFVYLVVAMRGNGSMIISPQGKVLADSQRARRSGDRRHRSAAGREGGDAFNMQRDMRGRLFRERVPEAYRILVDPAPPVLAKVPSNVTAEEAVRITGHRADRAAKSGSSRPRRSPAKGKHDEAIRAFEATVRGMPHVVDRSRGPRKRIETLLRRSDKDSRTAKNDTPDGIAAKYPGDVGIEKDRSRRLCRKLRSSRRSTKSKNAGKP